MYFWNIEALKRDIRRKPLAERVVFSYFFAHLIISLLESSLGLLFYSSPYELLELRIQSFLGMAIFVAAVPVLYVCNGGATGKDLLPRLIALGWVMYIRWYLLYLIPSAFLYGLGYAIVYGTGQEPTFAEYTVLYLALVIVLIVLLGAHLKDVAHQTKTKSSD